MKNAWKRAGAVLIDWVVYLLSIPFLIAVMAFYALFFPFFAD